MPSNNWLERLQKFSEKMPKNQAAQLSEDLQEFQSGLTEIDDMVNELTSGLEEWDEAEDRDDRAVAKEASEEVIDQLIEALRNLVFTVAEIRV